MAAESTYAGLTLSEAKAKLERMAAHVRNVRETGQEIMERGMVATANYVGAGLAGAMRGRFGEGPQRSVFIPNTEIEIDSLVGFFGSLAGVGGAFGKESVVATSLFSSIGGYAFGRDVEEKVAKSTAEKKASGG